MLGRADGLVRPRRGVGLHDSTLAAGLWVAAPVALLAVALALRSVWLAERQLFRDEAASWLTASYPLVDLLSHAAGEVYPPLYLVLLKVWIGLFGEGAVALRSLSVLAGMTTVVAGWRWAHEALGRFGGLAALAFLAVQPILVANARDARMYALESAFATLAWWLTWRLAAGEGGPGRPTASAVALCLAVAGEVWTFSLGLPVAGLQLAFAAACWAVRRRDAAAARRMSPTSRRRGTTAAARADASSVPLGPVAIRSPGLACLAIVVGAISLVPWLPNLGSAILTGQAFWTPAPGVDDLFGALVWPNVAFRSVDVASALAVVALGLALAGLVALLAGAGRPRPASRASARLLGLAAGLGAALLPLAWTYSALHSIFDPRYLGAAVPPLAVAFAAGALTVGSAIEAAWLPTALGLGLVAAVGSQAAGYLDVGRLNAGLPPAQATVERLASLVRPGDAVLTVDAQSYFPLAYLLREGRGTATLPGPLWDWHEPGDMRYGGVHLIQDDRVVGPDLVSRLGWRAALGGLRPGAAIWLISLDGGDSAADGFSPLRAGQLVEVARLDVRANDVRADIRRLRLPDAAP